MSPNKPISRRDTGFPNRMAGTNNRHPDAKVLTVPWEPEDPDAIFRQRLLSRGGTTALRPITSYLPSPPTTAFRSLPNTMATTSSTFTTPNRSPSLGTSPPGSSGSSGSNATFPSFPGTASIPPVPVPGSHGVTGLRTVSAEDSSSKERSDSFGSTSSAGTMASTDSATSLASRISASERSGWGAWAARVGEWNEKRKARRNASFKRH